MVTTGGLWLPILVATVLCFLGGFLLHMVLPVHRKDFARLPDEDSLLAALRGAGVSPGNYMFPMPTDMAAMREPSFIAKLATGPVGIMTVRTPGPMAMAPALVKQVFFHLLVSSVLAWLASQTIAAGAEDLRVFRIVGAAGFLAYTAAIFPAVIWYGQPRGFVMGKVIDGIVWSSLTAGAFAGLWPS